MKNLLLYFTFLAAFLTAGSVEATANNFDLFQDSNVITDPILEWIAKIEQMDPNGDAFQKEIATLQKSDDAESLARLGYVYFYGVGVKKDDEKAVDDYIRPAAEQGNDFGEYLLAQIYLNGHMFSEQGGIPQDQYKAMSLLTKSAQAGFAMAQHLLPDIYFGDQIVQIDITEGVKWLKKAANQGYGVSQFALGNLYAKDEGVTKNMRKAWEWTEKAAEGGYASYVDSSDSSEDKTSGMIFEVGGLLGFKVIGLGAGYVALDEALEEEYLNFRLTIFMF